MDEDYRFGLQFLSRLYPCPITREELAKINWNGEQENDEKQEAEVINKSGEIEEFVEVEGLDNCDLVRSLVLQATALRVQTIPQGVFREHFANMLNKYAHDVDQSETMASFHVQSDHFMENSARPRVDQSKFRSVLRSRLESGKISAGKLMFKYHKPTASWRKTAKKFQRFSDRRMISLPELPDGEEVKGDDEDDDDDVEENDESEEDDPMLEEGAQQVGEGDYDIPYQETHLEIGGTGHNSQESFSFEHSTESQQPSKIAKLIERQLGPVVTSPKPGTMEYKVRNSPTRVAGLFRKPGRTVKSLFHGNGAERQDEMATDSGSQDSIYSSEEPEPIDVVPSKPVEDKPKKNGFMTGLEKHLTNQILDNRMSSTQARRIVDDVRKNLVPFKNPTKKKKTPSESALTISNGEDPQLDSLVNDERLKGIEKSMIELIQSEIIHNLEGTDWENIAGLDFAKTKIKQIAILPLRRPDLFTGIRAPPKGILLFGPPGTGKTMIGRCIASQAKATFFSITASTLTSKWIGDGEKSMRTLFTVARCLKPSVIFIDEVDSLLKSRSDSEHEASRRMKTEFLAQFDGLSSQANDGLLVIGTTNRPQELDEAVRRRFAAKLFIPLPERSARRVMVLNNLGEEKHSLSEEDVEEIADKTEGYSGSDMKHLCTEAAMFSFREVMERLTELDKDDIRAITIEDFRSALTTVKPSFSSEDLRQYIEWNNKYGSECNYANQEPLDKIITSDDEYDYANNNI